MIVNFHLLGPFEAQVGTANRESLGDSKAAQIVAFLAFRNRFCTKDEIIAACWGANRLEDGENERDPLPSQPSRSSSLPLPPLNDDAYQKQIYKARDIFTDVLKLPWQDYFHSQSNGAQLKDGTFSTDVIRFDELFRIGTDDGQSAAVRLESLQKADRLRRGYLLDGMHSEWIVSQENGARKDYASKVQTMHRNIQQLQAASDLSGGTNRVPFCDGFYEAIPILRKAISEASREIIFYGIDLRVTIPVILDLLQERLQAGVRVKVLLLDPNAGWSTSLAPAISDSVETLREECRVSLRRLEALSKRRGIEAGLLEVSTFDGLCPGRLFGVDPDHSGGQLFYFPYMNGVAPTRLPGYIWPHRQDGPYTFYASELRRFWSNASNTSVSPAWMPAC
jgi:hypothetical protein